MVFNATKLLFVGKTISLLCGSPSLVVSTRLPKPKKQKRSKKRRALRREQSFLTSKDRR